MMKNCSIFAAFKTKRTKKYSVDGIFYARLNACICKEKEAVQIPAAVIGICQFFWSRMGGERPFLYSILNFSLAMTKRNENASEVKHSNHTSTPTERNAVSIEAFSIEKNAKNKAYYFILSHGLYDQFSKFCKNHHPDNPHGDCSEYLISNV
jgi:hypothetical protein